MRLTQHAKRPSTKELYGLSLVAAPVWAACTPNVAWAHRAGVQCIKKRRANLGQLVYMLVSIDKVGGKSCALRKNVKLLTNRLQQLRIAPLLQIAFLNDFG